MIDILTIEQCDECPHADDFQCPSDRCPACDNKQLDDEWEQFYRGVRRVLSA